jgi:hypothetical protein
VYSEPGVDEDDGPAGDDRWGDDEPPIRQRPPGLAPEDEAEEAYEAYEPDEAYEDSDALLFDHRRPDSRRPGSRRTGRRSRRTMRIAVPVIVVVAVAALALALLTGHGPKVGPATSDQHKTPNTAAPRLPMGAVTFDTYPGQQQRGVFQVINRIVAVGNTMVTTGSQTSDGVVRQQFLVSANAGASWHLAPVHSPGGAGPPGDVAGRRTGRLGGDRLARHLDQPERPDLDSRGHSRDHPADARRRGMGTQQDKHRLSGRRHRQRAWPKAAHRGDLDVTGRPDLAAAHRRAAGPGRARRDRAEHLVHHLAR